MPKLWTETIEGHREAVREAIMETTAELVAREGLRSVSMSQVAAEAGIGRATLYKYFPDIESILTTWHEQRLEHHLEHLAGLAETIGEGDRLVAVLEAYAFIQYEHRHGELAELLHRGDHFERIEKRFREFVRNLLSEAAGREEVRTDVPTAELTTYCLQALGAAARLPSKASVERLVALTVAGLRPAS